MGQELLNTSLYYGNSKIEVHDFCEENRLTIFFFLNGNWNMDKEGVHFVEG